MAGLDSAGREAFVWHLRHIIQRVGRTNSRGERQVRSLEVSGGIAETFIDMQADGRLCEKIECYRGGICLLSAEIHEGRVSIKRFRDDDWYHNWIV